MESKKNLFLFLHSKMSNFINSLLYGFTNILSVGPEEPREEGGCTGATGEGCCKDQPVKKDSKSCCQNDSEACCSSTPAVVTKKQEEHEASGCCKTDTAKDSCACEGDKEPVVIDNLKIIFSTLTGTAKTMASEIEKKIQDNTKVTVNKIEIMDVTEYDNDNLLQETAVCVFILSTYNVEGPLDW